MVATLLLQTIATVRVQLSTADLIKQAVNVQKYTVLEYLTFCLGVCGVLRGVGVGGGRERTSLCFNQFQQRNGL